MSSAVPLSLYVHLPWCRSKCPYCDFNSYALQGDAPVDAYTDALIRDLEIEAPFAGDRRLTSVFFGGGTPSLFPPASIARVLLMADRLIGLDSDAEVTMEANPGALESGPLREFRAAGVNRLSLGIQSLDDESLQRLGRLHNARTALAAIRQARAASFDNLNLDLMYGLPSQTLDMALQDVDRIIALEPSHISHYQLTLEPNTAFFSSPPALPGEDLRWDMQRECQSRLADAGYEQYEVSAYAKPSRRCRHNVNYWQFGDYLAIGAGAHGKVTSPDARITRRVKRSHPRAYDNDRNEFLAHVTRPNAEDTVFEFMLNALRLVDGFSWAVFEARTSLTRDAIQDVLDGLVVDGLLCVDESGCRPTAIGRRFLDDVTIRFLPPNGAQNTKCQDVA